MQGPGFGWCVAVVALCGMTMLNSGPAHGQAGIPSIPKPTSVRGPETNVIPSLSLSERYDSNVLFRPGVNLEDYVTTVSPQVRVIHKRQLIDAIVGGGATAEAYVKNPGLNYVAGNAFVDLNLDRAMSELVSGLGLRLSDSYTYTPQPPSFAAPTGGSQVSDSFVRGIQAQRANSHTNTGRVELSYAPSPVLSLTSTYTDQRIQFGRAVSTPAGVVQGSFINTTFQTVTSGPVVKISPVDTVTLFHQYQKGTFTTRSFSTQGAILGWTRLLTPTLMASVTGGASVFSMSNNLQYLGSASLGWRGEDTDVTLSYSRNIAPSFFVAASALLSQVVTGTVTHRVTESLALSLQGNYAINQSVPDSSLLKFESYSVTPSVNYRISRVVTATLSYTHSQFQQTFSSQESLFDRNMALLRLVAEWE